MTIEKQYHIFYTLHKCKNYLFVWSQQKMNKQYVSNNLLVKKKKYWILFKIIKNLSSFNK